MSDRGLPIVDGAQACPFVAFENDRDERATSPDPRHRCYAEERPAPRALAHQEAYCLASTFPVCPIFQDWARREAAQARVGGGESSGGQERESSRDWSAPPPWTGAAVAGAAAAGFGGFDDDDDNDDREYRDQRDDRDRDADRDEDGSGFLASRSAVAGAGLAGSAADRLAGSGRPDGDVTGDAESAEGRRVARLEGVEPDDRYDERAGDDRYDDGAEEDELESDRRGKPRSARASGGIGFGRDRRPKVGDTRRGRGGDETGPSWEQPRHHEPYPALQRRRGLPISRIGGMAIALVVAAIALFFLPQLLGLGGSPGPSGNRSLPPGGSAAPGASVDPTPVPAPTSQIYIVKPGDTMFGIAQQLGVSLDALIEANREAHPDPDTLQVGDQLIVPTPAPSGIGGSASPSAVP